MVEHNSYLELGETVVLTNSEQEATVVYSQYRNPLNRQELVKVLVRYVDVSERRMELPALGVQRLNLA